MKIIKKENSIIQLELTRNELIGISNALNEICNNSNIDEYDSHARLGITYQEALNLLKNVGQILQNWKSV